MKKIVEKDVEKELESIYGIENCKGEIIDYIKYLEVSKKSKFANYNIIIHNNSSYPGETKNKLIEFLSKMLEKTEITKNGYEYITEDQIKIFENKEEKESKKEKKTKTKIEKDLIILDSEKINRCLDNYSEEIKKMMEKYKNKVYIIIDNSYRAGDINALLNKYYDWFFQIDRISENDKKDYILNSLKENEINISKDCNYINKLAEDPFFIVKSKMNHIILKCKITNTNEITDEFAEKYLEKQKIAEKNTSKTSKNKNQRLESLIGIENIKEEVNKIVNYVKVCKKRNKEMPTLHMCFTGNPGTGKTTVARIIGEIFRKEKILSRGQFVEIHGRDLVGKYVGWTAKEVKDQIRKAKGGILFIDEAYSLNSDTKGSFEDEAIATLIKEMEDKRDDICVILAGYQKEMQDLIKRNPGFESRIQFYLDFPNYNENELYEIFKKLAKKEGYKISRNIKPILQEDFKEKSKKNNFSNGRYVRNIYEKIKIEQANRILKENDENINLIKKSDIEKILETEKPETTKKIKIGFSIKEQKRTLITLTLIRI